MSEKVRQLLKKLNIQRSYDPATLLGVSLREMKAYAHKIIYTRIFIAALFLIAKN